MRLAPRHESVACKTMTRLCVSGSPQSAPTSKTAETQQKKWPKQIYRLNMFWRFWRFVVLSLVPRRETEACKTMAHLCVSGIPQSAPPSKTAETKQKKRPKQIHIMNLFWPFSKLAVLFLAPRRRTATSKTMTRLCVLDIPQSAPHSKTAERKRKNGQNRFILWICFGHFRNLPFCFWRLAEERRPQKHVAFAYELPVGICRQIANGPLKKKRTRLPPFFRFRDRRLPRSLFKKSKI